MSNERNFMKRLDKLFQDFDGDPDQVFHALGIDGGSDVESGSSDDESDNFDIKAALETWESNADLSDDDNNQNENPVPNLDDPFDDVNLLSFPQFTSNDSTEMVQPIPSTSKDVVGQNGKNKPSPTRKSPRNTTKFTRRRDAAPTHVVAPPEYLSKIELRKMNWHDHSFCDNNMPFTGNTTLPEDLRTLQTPWQFFNYFFPQELVEKIMEETMNYTSQKDITNQLTLELDEIYRYLGICILSSIIHLPNIRSYWSNIGVDAIKQSMSVNRFEKIRQFIHFNDNSILDDENAIHDAARKDRLFKIRPLIDTLLTRFQTVPPPQKLSLDEQVCATKNRTYLKNYMPNKPHKWGYKLFVLTDTVGYVHNFEIYTGAVEEFLPNEPNLGAAGNIVMRLCRILEDGKNYQLYYDNYYLSVPLAVYLYHRGILVVGTIIRNRIPDRYYLPKLPKPKRTKKTAKKTPKPVPIKSKFSLPSLDALKDSDRGSILERVGVIRRTPCVFLSWKDNKTVSFLSTFIGSDPISTIKRYDRKAKEKKEIQCPAVVKTYNLHMGGVDLLDAHVSRYKIRVKSRKWYLRLFYHLIDLTVINSWLVWRKCLNSTASLATFKEELGLVLCRKGYVAHTTRGRKATSVQSKIMKKKYKSKTNVPSQDTRLDRINHWPAHDDSRNRCRYPECRQKTYVKCTKCEVFLCLSSKHNCFVLYHTN